MARRVSDHMLAATTKTFCSQQSTDYGKLEFELQGVQLQPLSLDEKCKNWNHPENSDKGEAFVQKKRKSARRRGFNRDRATSEYSGFS
jgi:hypothetical protein